MKWLALVLALANAGLWFYGPSLVPSSRSLAQGEGSLPRVTTLKTLSEPEAPTPMSESLPEPLPAPLVEPGLSCLRVGWFEVESDAQSGAKALGLGGGQFRVERRERERAPLHWVLIPPQPPEQALEAFRDIQRRGIDSYLVTEGENSFAISLGLFESRASAISVLEEKKRQNLNAILAIFPRNQLSYALVFEAGHFQDAEEIRAAKSAYQQNFEFVEIRSCEGVATPAENP